VSPLPATARASEPEAGFDVLAHFERFVDAERCFRFWSNQNSDCSIRVRVCPCNRDFATFAARVWRSLAGTPLRRLALRLADAFAPGGRVSPDPSWERRTVHG